MNETIEILKVDEAGRVRTPRGKQEEILAAMKMSGMSGRQFARHIGVKYPTLMNWVQKRRRDRNEEAEPARQQWIEAVVEDVQTGLRLEIHGGLVLRVSNQAEAGVAATILRNLGYGRSC